MEVIPVIDVAHGEVVRAVKGERSAYRPIETPLSSSSEPAELARGLAKLFPFRTLYVADLDGIEGRGPQYASGAGAQPTSCHAQRFGSMPAPHRVGRRASFSRRPL